MAQPASISHTTPTKRNALAFQKPVTVAPLPRYRPEAALITAAVLVSYMALRHTVDAPSASRWHAGLGSFDSGPRAVLRAGKNGRRAADQVSDVLLIGLIGHAAVFDPFVGRGLWHGDYHGAMHVALINGSMLLLTELTTTVLKLTTARARPFVAACIDRGEAPGCENSAPFLSFPSAHSAQAFASASLTCLHHQKILGYGSEAATAIQCASLFTLATTTAMLRVVADKHHLTDTLVGAGIGAFLGYLVPRWVHYTQRHKKQHRKTVSGQEAHLSFRPRRVQLMLPRLGRREVGLSYFTTW